MTNTHLVMVVHAGKISPAFVTSDFDETLEQTEKPKYVGVYFAMISASTAALNKTYIKNQSISNIRL